MGISDKELHEQGIEEDADPALNLLELLGKVETRAIEVTTRQLNEPALYKTT